MSTHPETEFEIQHRLGQVVMAYFAAIDDTTLSTELLATLFAADGAIRRPNDALTTGPQAIFESQDASFKRFRATQHIVTNLLFSQAGQGWKLRANLQAMHIWAPEAIDPTALETYFLAHSVLEASFVQEGGAWKIALLGVRVVWRTGSGMGAILKT